jgi:hypothetical protein
MTGCGNNAIGQFWLHKNAIWNKVGGGPTGTNGFDHGSSNNIAFLDPSGGGTYAISGDWFNPGVDGCSNTAGVSPQEGSAGACGSSPDWVPTDVVVAGQSSANPTQAVVLFGSADINPLAGFYILDNLGATNPTPADPCGGLAEAGPMITCGTVPAPSIVSSAAGAAGHVIYQVSLPAQNIPYVDDCGVAESAAVNCPRNLNAGRVLMVRRAPCRGGTPANNLTATYVDFPSTRTEFWHPYNAGDTDYNGLVDATATPNPITLISSSAQTIPVDITQAVTATSNDNCIYFGAAAAADASPNSGFTPWLAPYVSMATRVAPLQQFICPCNLSDTACSAAGASCGAGCGTCAANTTGATAAPDRVLDLRATKVAGGKYNVSWVTSSETSIAKFDLVGNKSGGTVALKSSIDPKGDGVGSSYSFNFAAGEMKGTKQVSVVVFYTDGSKATFGPAPVQ